MKVLVVSNLFPPHFLGGYEIECMQVCHALQERGYDLHVLSSSYGGSADCHFPYPVSRSLDLYLSFEMESRLLRFKRWKVGRRNYQTVRQAISRYKPDLIFLWSQLRLTTGCAKAAHDSGCRVLWRLGDETIAGYLPEPFQPTLRGVYRYAMDYGVFRGDLLSMHSFKHASCISHCLKRNLMMKGLPLKEADVTYRGIPLASFPFVQKSMSKTPRLLYVGQLHHYKGVHTIIEALRYFSSGVQLSIVGRGTPSYENELKKRAMELSVPVHFQGLVPYEQTSRYYLDHDIFIFPSIWQEPMGVTYIEAMASGLPVISTAKGGQGELLENNKTALLFEPEDAKGLAEAVSRLVEDDALRNSLVHRGRAWVEEKMSFEHYVDELEKSMTKASL